MSQLDAGYPALAKQAAHDYGIDFDWVYAEWVKIASERRAQKMAAQMEEAVEHYNRNAQLEAKEARRRARECKEAMAKAAEYREEAEDHRFFTDTYNKKLRQQAWSKVRAAEHKAEMYESKCTEGAPRTAEIPRPSSAPSQTTQGSAPLTLPAPAPQPSIITNCDPAGCWDNLGGRYTKGAGNTYFPTTGGSCQLVGGQMNCF